MQRYAIFAYAVYYPSGGWHDLVASCATIDEARARAKELVADEDATYDVAQIVDLQDPEGGIVEKVYTEREY